MVVDVDAAGLEDGVKEEKGCWRDKHVRVLGRFLAAGWARHTPLIRRGTWQTWQT